MSKYDESSIKVLSGLEHVRLRPSMYIGSTGSDGLNHLIYEILDNSVDEALAGYCDYITVTLEDDGSIRVADNGRGIPIGLHSSGIPTPRVVFTKLNAGGKFDNNVYKASGGLHGVGASVVNALSSKLVLTVYRDGKIYRDGFEKGVPISEYRIEKQVGKPQSGTGVTFFPDKSIFKDAKIKVDVLKTRLHQLAYLNPGLKIRFEDERITPSEVVEYKEAKGLAGYVSSIISSKLGSIISYSNSADGDEGEIQVEVAFAYSNSFSNHTYSFCNNIYNSEEGSHVSGFRIALTTFMNKAARDLGILKPKDANFVGEDVRTGLTAVISIHHPNPRFEGQTKTKLDNQDASRVVSQITSTALQEYFAKHQSDLKSILKLINKAAKVRLATIKTKENMISTKKRFSFESNGKLANCGSNDAEKCELFIVEGESAAGSAKTGRDRHYQAILPLKGKILNVEKATKAKILANAEIKTLIYALNCGFSQGYGKDFDITNLRYHKIILLTDADVDGSHIDTLLLTLFYRLMPELIHAGHVYVAVPPLYCATGKRGKKTYIYNDKELEVYRRDHSGFTLQRYKGLGEMDAEQLWETTMNPETRLLRKITISDIEAAEKSTSDLMGDDTEARKLFINENAQYANLDV